MTDIGLYRRWLDYLFDRPETKPTWFFESGDQFEAESDPDAIVDLCSQSC